MPLFRVKRTIGKKFRRGDECNFPMATVKRLAENATGNEDDWPTFFEVLDRYAKASEYGFKKKAPRPRSL